jgi:hypothetical protein
MLGLVTDASQRVGGQGGQLLAVMGAGREGTMMQQLVNNINFPFAIIYSTYQWYAVLPVNM